MAIAITLKDYLTNHHADYQVVTHLPTASALRTAEVGHIPGDSLAKAVVLKDEDGFFVAVLPATHRIRLGLLSGLLGRRIGLATEAEADQLFEDCRLGAFPAIGDAYDLTVVVEESLDHLADVYFEGGDHESLVHVSGQQFQSLVAGAEHGHFSDHL